MTWYKNKKGRYFQLSQFNLLKVDEFHEKKVFITGVVNHSIVDVLIEEFETIEEAQQKLDQMIDGLNTVEDRLFGIDYEIRELSKNVLAIAAVIEN